MARSRSKSDAELKKTRLLPMDSGALRLEAVPESPPVQRVTITLRGTMSQTRAENQRVTTPILIPKYVGVWFWWKAC